MTPPVTILVPSFRTPELTTLCLRLLRRHTPSALARVVVIDNGSADASLGYLRGLRWIELLERTPAQDEGPALAHARALDLGLERVDTPFVLSIHTDTLVRRGGWLERLLAPLEADAGLSGVGSWKLEDPPSRARALLDAARRGARALLGGAEEARYLRSHCALWRVAPLRALGLAFGTDGPPAGRGLHRRLVAAGQRVLFLPSDVLGRDLVHANHATMVLNPGLGIDARARRRGLARLRQVWTDLGAEAVLADPSLDA